MTDGDKWIQVFRLLLAQLEGLVDSMPQTVAEDGRTDSLSNQIQSYQTQLARVKNVLRKHQEAERRKREIDRENKAHARKH